MVKWFVPSADAYQIEREGKTKPYEAGPRSALGGVKLLRTSVQKYGDFTITECRDSKSCAIGLDSFPRVSVQF